MLRMTSVQRLAFETQCEVRTRGGQSETEEPGAEQVNSVAPRSVFRHLMEERSLLATVFWFAAFASPL